MIRASVVFLVAPLHTAISQELASLRAGEPIRLSVIAPMSARVEGRLVSLSSDAIVLSGANNQLPIRLAEIRVLEVERRSSGSVFRSIAFGLVSGAVGGALIGLASGDTNTGDGTLTSGGKAVILSILGGTVGLVGGTIHGACCSSSWQPVPVLPERL